MKKKMKERILWKIKYIINILLTVSWPIFKKLNEFGENLKKEYSSTHPSHVLSYIHLLYLWEQPRFIQKRMACQPRRDIYGRRHASSRVLTARAGRMASPPSSNVIRRTNGPGCRDPSSRKYGGYRSRFAPVNSTVPAVTWPDVGQTWRGREGFW